MHEHVVDCEPIRSSDFADHRSMTAPSILLWPGDHPRAHRIEGDIAQHFKAIGLALDEPNIGTALKEIPDTSTSSVECRRILAVEPLHPLRERLTFKFNDEVKMIGHEYVCGQDPLVPLDATPEQVEKELAI